MKRGVQTYTVRDFMGSREEVESSLRKIKEIGYDSVQTWTPSFMSHAEHKALLDDIGLETCSSGGSYEQMLEDPAAIEEAVEQAKIYGVKYIGVGTLPRELRECESGYRQYAENINKIASQLKQENMKLLYHNHALEFFSLGGGLMGMDIILGDTDPDGLHFALDTHWLTAGGVNVVDWIYKVKGRMGIIHFKDYAIVGGAMKIEDVHKNFAEVGEGNIDWPNVVKACKDIGVEFAIVEQDICPGDPFDSLKISFDNMVKFGV
ncbi:MAG TPA: sugar phosphate isomerase/epimerase family protein [Clostridia bacterium]|nr:sugar phosphate isomerase/epimerase family protein [Clostridia bacterium]